MSALIYPTLPGFMYPQQRDVVPPPVQVRTTPSQREYRARDAALPRYQYGLQYEFLRTGTRGAELASLVGFYNKVGGPFDSWLYSDPDDNTAVAQLFGVGNGATQGFQLLRGFGGFAEPVFDLQAAPAIYLAGVLQASGYTVSSTGWVSFTAAPGAGVALTWSGAFYRRCRFLGDRLNTTKFMDQMFEAKRVEFISTKA